MFGPRYGKFGRGTAGGEPAHTNPHAHKNSDSSISAVALSAGPRPVATPANKTQWMLRRGVVKTCALRTDRPKAVL